MTTCKNCGNHFNGNYCNFCGEKVYHDHHKKVSHLAEEVIHFLTHFEGSLLTTLKAVFTKPGQLSLDYCNGVRKKYFKPISFFLVCVVLYLLFPKFEGLNMKLYVYSEPRYGYDWFAVPVIQKKMERKNITYAELTKKYESKTPKFAKAFLLVLLPLMAFVMYGLFFKRRKFYFDHFILAIEFTSVFIIIKYLLLPLTMVIGSYFNSGFEAYFDDSNQYLHRSIDILMVVILSLQFRRFYGQRWGWTILKALLFYAIFAVPVMLVYHSLLFLFVMLFI